MGKVNQYDQIAPVQSMNVLETFLSLTGNRKFSVEDFSGLIIINLEN